jgi:methenyltetrahydrofolate cyclohydrolase
MSSDKDYLSLPLRTFLADLAAKTPTPGGGSVAALVAALAAAQARMVIEYTVGKPKFAAHEPHLREALEELKRAEAAFAELMDEDMAAYERLSVARKCADPAEQQRAVATATAVPMELVAMAGAVAGVLDEIKTCVNPHLLSDLKVSAILMLAAARSASLNVEINLRELTDRAEAAQLDEQVTRMVEKTHEHRNAVVHHHSD